MKPAVLSRSELLERVDELLEARYRSGDLGNLADPLAETVYILLSQQTQEPVYRRLFAELRRRYPRWLEVLDASEEDLAALLHPGGLHRQRASKLHRLLAAVELANRERGIGPTADPQADLTLDFLHPMTDVEAEKFLMSLPGVGLKSARCVLSYSLARATFAVDTHVHRIFTRLELVDSNGRKRDHDPFQDAVPEHMRGRLHVNLVHHGRAICRSQRERCDDCVLVSFCARGRSVAGNDDNRPVAVDLFAGAGGMGRGFRDAGFRVALAVESNRHAAQTYRLNNPGVPVIEAEIDRSTSGDELRSYVPRVGRIATLLAGPPCQGYSAAGARDPRAPANLLYRHIARLAKDLDVETVCLENVPGVRRVNGRVFINRIIKNLEAANLAVAAYLLHACEFGVPQHRARYFFLARRGRTAPKIAAPTPTHHPRHVSKWDGADPPERLTPRLDERLLEVPVLPAGATAEYFVGNDGQVGLNMSTMTHSAKVISKIKTIKTGTGPISYRRLDPIEARTLIAGHRALPVHPTAHRTISVREAAIIQGFPLSYFFCGPRAEQPLQVANAVPPPLAEAVAIQLRDCLEGPRLTGRRTPGEPV